MKKFKTLLFVAFLAMVTNVSNAQDKDNPWAFSLGVNMVEPTPYGISEPFDQFKDYITLNDLNFGVNLSAAKYLKNGFTLDLTGAINSIEKVESYTIGKQDYYSLDLGVRYDLNKLFGETGWFDPYVRFAVGGFNVDGEYGAAVSPSLGFNTWFNDNWGLNFGSSYKSSALFGELATARVVKNYHFQHAVSVVYQFGAKDTDGDGVKDKDDLCPEVAGSPVLYGCPDADGDGVADSDDLCPNAAGSENNKGCPDSDGDGTLDKHDLCPDVAGTLNGCPDADGDGVADADDKCPNAAGSLNGCPDSDGDGIADADDNCPNKAGGDSTNGCPGLTDAEKALIEETDFKFGFDKQKFDAEEITTLDDVTELLTRVETVKLEVAGHTDSVGPKAYNLKLSKERAQAVVKYFETKGIDASRLTIVGYGEAQPVSSNNTASGRADNRRVELILLEE